MSKRKEIQIVLFVAYCGFIVWMTILNRQQYNHRVIRIELFWAFREWLAGVEKGKTESILYFKNILFFMPFGFLLPIKNNWKKAIVIAALMSLIIEVVQCVTMLGKFEIDDIVANSLGTVIGYFVYEICKSIMSFFAAIRSKEKDK